jgi:ketosteroid isomerase-like protein
MNTRLSAVILALLVIIPAVHAQTTTEKPAARPRTTTAGKPTPTATQQPEPTPVKSTAPTSTNPAGGRATPSGPEALISAFNTLLDGIRHLDVKAVTGVYWNSSRLILFNNNGTVTKGWEQMRENRESSYPEIKDVKLDVHDVSVTMLGRDGAVITCLWNQVQIYKGNPESASGRMTLVFRRVGNTWKAVHLHTSPDAPNPARVLPSEQTPPATPTPSPASKP